MLLPHTRLQFCRKEKVVVSDVVDDDPMSGTGNSPHERMAPDSWAHKERNDRHRILQPYSWLQSFQKTNKQTNKN